MQYAGGNSDDNNNNNGSGSYAKLGQSLTAPEEALPTMTATVRDDYCYPSFYWLSPNDETKNSCSEISMRGGECQTCVYKYIYMRL